MGENGRYCDPLQRNFTSVVRPAALRIPLPPLTVSKPLAISPKPISASNSPRKISKSPRKVRQRNSLRHSLTSDNLQLQEIQQAIQDIELRDKYSPIRKTYSFTAGACYSNFNYRLSPSATRLCSHRSAFLPSQ